MNNSNNLNKEQYFNMFSSLITDLKKNEKKETEELENIFNNIKLYNNLNFQEILTYMLYCFEIIELTGKWKLKKIINYSLFLDNLDEIYNAIFCNVTTVFKNKVVAATSFETIIEKTINYNIETQIEPVLSGFLKCLSEKHFHTKDINLTLLRGNIYCGIYNNIKDNSDINEVCKKYLFLISEVFDYKRYMNGAVKYYKNLINHDCISYLEITNYLLFKTYNNHNIDGIELKKIIKNLFTKYNKEYFNKKIFITIFSAVIDDLSSKYSMNIKFDVVFDDKEFEKGIIYLNYNKIECNFYSNLDFLKKIFYFVKNQKYDEMDNELDYINLLKIKSKLVNNKAIYNYDNMLEYVTLLELNDYLGELNDKNGYEYFDKLIVKCVDKSEYKLSENELFQAEYNSAQIKDLEEKYPILKLEYENGLYKSVATIIREKNNLVKSEKNSDIAVKIKIYNNLIKYRNCDFDSLLNDYYSLLLLDTIDNNLIKEKEYVLKEILPKLVEQQIKFSGKITKEKYDEIYNDYIDPCITKISQDRVNNKNLDSTKDFLNFEKSNADNYVAICKLQEILKNVS